MSTNVLLFVEKSAGEQGLRDEVCPGRPASGTRAGFPETDIRKHTILIPTNV